MNLKKESLEDLEFVVFDTETTGIHTISAWPVEIAGVRMCGTFLTDRCYSSLCRPDVIITLEGLIMFDTHYIAQKLLSAPPYSLDVGPILKISVPVSRVALGLFSIFILCWFAGTYNLGVPLG